MSEVKDKLKILIKQQPEDSNSEEIIRELAFHLMIERGLKDASTGNIVSNDEVLHRIQQWSK